MTRSLPLLAALTAACLAPGAAGAAESYDNCTGFIETIPTTISTQGTWCMKKDLVSGIDSGAVITIAANNITLDCNDFKLGGLSAGSGTGAIGVQALGRTNVTVRGCNIRGFYVGVYLQGANFLVEQNRFEGNTVTGVAVNGDGSIIRDNRVSDTGGSTIPVATYTGIQATGSTQIRGNTVNGVNFSGDGSAFGIYVASGASVIADNVVAQYTTGSTAPGDSAGIRLDGTTGSVVERNVVQGQGADNEAGIYCNGVSIGVRDNVLVSTTVDFPGCTDLGDNDAL